MIKKFFEVFVIFLLLSMPLTLAQEDDSQKQGFFSKIASAFGDFFKMNISHDGGGISGDPFVPPNYDSDDSDAKLSDWDC